MAILKPWYKSSPLARSARVEAVGRLRVRCALDQVRDGRAPRLYRNPMTFRPHLSDTFAARAWGQVVRRLSGGGPRPPPFSIWPPSSAAARPMPDAALPPREAWSEVPSLGGCPHDPRQGGVSAVPSGGGCFRGHRIRLPFRRGGRMARRCARLLGARSPGSWAARPALPRWPA
jgi:hypothetical protein